jgi:hypothetical protein
MRRGVLTLMAALAVLSAVAPASGARAARARPVLDSKAGEFQPARSGDYLSWERSTRARPTRYKVYARRAGRRRFRVNAPGTEGANGGIDGGLLVYQQFRKRRSDIVFFDLARRRRGNPPEGVNTRHWEYWPTISGKWLLLGRYKRRAGDRKVLLRNTSTGARRVLAKTTSRRAFVAPGQVNGAWAVYSKCTPVTRCDVYRYNLATGHGSKLPNPGFYQRAPSVTSSGTVYFVRSRRRCGNSVRLVRLPLGGPRKAVARLPEGIDVGDTYVDSSGSGRNRLLFDRRRCDRPAGSNIYGLGQPRLITLRTRTDGAGSGAVTSRPAGIRCGADCTHSYGAGTTVSLRAAPESSSNFTGWGGACSGRAATCSTTLTAGRWVIAFFDPASSFSLSVAKRGAGRGRVTSKPAGIDCGRDCSEPYRAGTSVTLTATPARGSRFAGWSGACSGAGKCTVTVDRVRAVTATFTRATRTSATRALQSGAGYPGYLDANGAAPARPSL